MIRSFLVLAAAVMTGFLSTFATAQGENKAAAGYENVVASPIRTDQDRRMDASRHPAEFLMFVQVKPGMPRDEPSSEPKVPTDKFALRFVRPQ